MPTLIPTPRHSGAYRRRTALAPTPEPFAFGTGERLVLSFPLPVEEVVRRLSVISVPDASQDNLRGQPLRFVGKVQTPEFRLALNARLGPLTQIRGRISTDADMTQLQLETLVVPIVPLGAIVIAVALPVMAAAERRPPSTVWFWASLSVVGVVLSIVAAIATVRSGLPRARRVILDALLPERDPEAGDDDLPPTVEELIERVESRVHDHRD